jgi:hypothetical protein
MELPPLLTSILFLTHFTSFYVPIVSIKKMFSQHSNGPTPFLHRKCIPTIYKGSPRLKKMD